MSPTEFAEPTQDPVELRGLRIRSISELVPGWRGLLEPGEEQVVANYGRPRGPGSRPALVLIDFQRSYLGRDVPVEQQLDEFPAGSGAGAWRALERALVVLDSARRANVPVLLTIVAHTTEQSATTFDAKRAAGAGLAEGSAAVALPDQLTMRADDVLIAKQAASAFHQTTFDEHLARLGVDTLVLAGLSTSGCVRATAVDAAARGLRPIVVADAVADRLHISHRVGLLDLWMKYADLCLAADAASYLNGGRSSAGV